MSKTQVNGVGSSNGHSITIDHLVSYPLVSDLFNFYKSMPLGAKTLELSHNFYLQFGKPVIFSSLVQNPYSYVYPYAKKVDELGDNTLNQIDASFPAIKQTDLESLKTQANSAIGYPFKIATEGKDYVVNMYSDEYNRSGSQGIVNAGRAIVTTELRIASEALQKVGEWVGPKKSAAEAKLERAKDVGTEKATQAKKTAMDKKKEITN